MATEVEPLTSQQATALLYKMKKAISANGLHGREVMDELQKQWAKLRGREYVPRPKPFNYHPPSVESGEREKEEDSPTRRGSRTGIGRAK